MKRDEAIIILRAQRPKLESLGVAHLSIFGSVARDEATDESDLDILVDSRDGRAFGFFSLADILGVIRAATGRNVDLLSRAGVSTAPRLAKTIDRERIDVF